MKVSQFEDVPTDVRAVWLGFIHSSVLAYELVSEICRTHPVKGVVHHNDYSLNLGARLAVERHGGSAISQTHASHRNIDRRNICLRTSVGPATYTNQVEAWPLFRELALTPAQVEDVGQDILLRLEGRGSHTFSPGREAVSEDPRPGLGLSRKRLIVAYTSSMDEMVATSMTAAGMGLEDRKGCQTFGDQIGWLKALINFVQTRDDVQLAVRIHPREGAKSKGGGNVASQHLTRLRAAFDRPIRDVKFFWPDDPVSSYNLGELADVVTFSWSTIGLEMARLGVPAIASSKDVSWFPHDDFLEYADSPEAYFDVLQALLAREPLLATVARAFRWYHLMHLGTSISFSDVILRADQNCLPDYKTPREAETVERIVVGGEPPLQINLSRQRAAQRDGAAAAEAAAIRRQIRRVLRYLFTGQSGEDDYALVVSPDGDVPAAVDGATNAATGQPPAAVLQVDGQMARFRFGGHVHQHLSPMAARLARLLSGTDGAAAAQTRPPAALSIADV